MKTMKSNLKLKNSQYHSDSEVSKRQYVENLSKLKTKRINSEKKSSSSAEEDVSPLTPMPKQSKKKLFSSTVSLKTVLNQFLSEDVYEDLISFLIILMSLPLILIKRLFSLLYWIYIKFDAFFFYSIKQVNQCLEEKKKNSFEKRRFSKNTKLELFFKKKQLEQKSQICKDNKLDLVLDLDETLIHCTDQKPSYKSQEFEIPKKNQTDKMDKFYLSQRPFLEDFLDEVSLFFNVHVYTASEKDYADMILSYIDPKHKIQKKLYRNDCWKEKEGWTKDLSKINEDLSKVIMIDNSDDAVKHFLENSFIIKSWHGFDKNDTELEHYAKILIEMAYSKEDVRTKVKKIKRDLKYKYLS